MEKGHVSVRLVKSPARNGGVKVTVQTQRTSVSVSFLHIGQPQVITAPAHAADVYGHG